ncbi:MAG TPA: SMP-30/gluconolactonase/LRE family protein [Acidimicrobiia bacterium]|nr:SMP-30/gluconolactonase/LRE family protein [Acidimicrobiia bacterium]
MEIKEIATGLQFPEGPVWMPDGTVLCVEMKEPRIVRVQPDGEKEVVAEPGGSPNGLAMGPDGALYVCNSGGYAYREVADMLVPEMNLPAHHSGGRIERVDLATGDVKVLYTECDGHPFISLNDLVFDETGNFWFTDHGRWRERDKTHGGLYYAAPDGSSVREMAYPLDAPNGVGLSPDGKRVYVAETMTGRLYAWDLSAPGEIDRTNPLFDHGGHVLAGVEGFQLFDSLGVEEGGNVVIGTIVNGGLTVISPTGEVVEHVPVPDLLVTNVCFGGEDRRTAYATCSGTGKLVSMPWPRPGLQLAF